MCTCRYRDTKPISIGTRVFSSQRIRVGEQCTACCARAAQLRAYAAQALRNTSEGLAMDGSLRRELDFDDYAKRYFAQNGEV